MPEQIVILIIFTQLEDMCSKPIKMSCTFSGKVIASGLYIDNIRFLICSFRSQIAKYGKSSFAVRDLIRPEEMLASNLIVVSFKWNTYCPLGLAGYQRVLSPLYTAQCVSGQRSSVKEHLYTGNVYLKTNQLFNTHLQSIPGK